MKMRLMAALIIIAAGNNLICSVKAVEPPPGFTALFNGQDLSGCGALLVEVAVHLQLESHDVGEPTVGRSVLVVTVFCAIT